MKVSVSDAAKETCNAFMTQAAGCGKKLDLSIEDRLFMQGHEQSIRQMMSILLDNALRYSDPQTAISISLCAKHSKPPHIV